MTIEEAYAAVAKVVATVAAEIEEKDGTSHCRSRELHDPDASLSDFYFNSLAEIDLCMLLEKETGVVIDPSELSTHSSIGAIAKLLIVRAAATET